MGKLVFSCIAPHPPILIPHVGKKQIEKVAASQAALKEIGRRIAAIHETTPIDTMIVISPHTTQERDAIPLYAAPHFYGDFGRFRAPDVKMAIPGDPQLAKAIARHAKQAEIPLIAHEEPPFLDWGIMVPLYYIHQAGVKIPMVPMSFAFLPLSELYRFGESLYQAILASDKNVALIASGDLSHRLIPSAPAGYTEMGKVYDAYVIEKLKNLDIDGFLATEDPFIQEAGECGIRSFAILLGALSKAHVTPEILSYEGPFGVGYLVADFQLEHKLERAEAL